MIRVTDLNIEFFDHERPETVVYDFDLTLHEGEIVGLVGESGSGKSMSALAIAGLLSRKDMKKRGEILFEGVNLLDWQVEEALRLHTELSKEERKKRAIEMLEKVELHNPQQVYEQYPHELSGGMRQRVMIAAAMICDPKLLIADEPTTALDVTIQEQIVALLKRINREKKTAILFISHDLSLVRQLCERVLVMRGGYVVESGPVDEIFYHPKEEYTKKLIAAIPRVIRKTEKDS